MEWIYYYRIIFLDEIRKLFFKKSSITNSSGSVSTLRIFSYLLVIFFIYSFSFLIPTNIVQYTDTVISFDNLKFIIWLLISVIILVIGAISSFAFLLDIKSNENEYVNSLPLSRNKLLIPKLLLSINDVLAIVLFLIGPILLLYLNIFNYSFFNLIKSISYSLMSLTLIFLITLLLLNIIIYFSPRLKTEAFFVVFIISIVLAMSILLLSLFNNSDLIVSKLYYYDNKLENIDIIRLFLGILIFGDLKISLLLIIITCIGVYFLFILNLKLLKANKNKSIQIHVNRKVKNYELSSKIFFSGIIGAFIKKDALQLVREPFEVIKNILFMFFISFVILKVFGSSSRDIVMYVIYSVPLSLCGTLILQTIGNEGSNIYIIKLVSTIRYFFFSKLIVGLIYVLPLSLISAAIIGYFFFPNTTFNTILIRFFLIGITTLAALFLTLSIGGIFADFNAKRMFPSRGISIFGEMSYWLGSGFIALSFYWLDIGILWGDFTYLILGTIMSLCILIVDLIIYRICFKKLINLE